MLYNFIIITREVLLWLFVFAILFLEGGYFRIVPRYDNDVNIGSSNTAPAFYYKYPIAQECNFRTYIFNDILIDLDNIISNKLYVKYGASGEAQDKWKNNNLILNLTIY